MNGARLYGILDLGYVSADRAVPVAREMILGGVGVIQLRAKKQPGAEIVRIGKALAEICSDAAIPFILNDHPELVAECGAGGAHVGQDDLSITEARLLAGVGSLIGKSTHSLAQAKAAYAAGADYIGFGPLYATPTKPDYVPVGLEEIRAIHAAVPIPIYCIGGIKRENLGEVLDAGARRVVIVSGILGADDVAGYCRDVVAALSRVG